MSSAPPTPRFTSFTMILPTYNEAARVRRVIEHYRPFARLIVIDNLSTDRTVEIARDLGVEVISYPNAGTPQTPEWFRHVVTLFDTEHFVLLMCAEFIPGALLERYDEIARTRAADVVSSVRESVTCGERMPKVWGKAPRIERFFGKSGLDCDAIVIHKPFVPVRPERLLMLPDEPRWRITHLRDADAASLVKKVMDYAVVEARQAVEQGKPINFRWLLSRLRKELGRMVRVRRSRAAVREVWARMVMHSIIYWVGWETRTGETLARSREASDALWLELTSKDPAPGAPGSVRSPRP